MEGQRLGETKQKKNFEMFASNPVLRRLSRIDDRQTDAKCATYSGIIVKTIYFLLLSIVGFGGYFLAGSTLKYGEAIDIDVAVIYMPQIIIALVAAFFTLVVPILSWFKFFRPIIPVAGTLYCISEGYLIGFTADTLAAEYDDVVILAFGVTVAIVLVMLFLYAAKIIKPNQKFKAILFTLMIVSILSGVAVFVLSLFPATRGMVNMVVGNPVISLVASIAFVIIAALFLIVDFDIIRNTVETRMPKKYEWMASFGLAFTVIWLYLKVLDLIIRLKGNNN